MVYRVVPYFAYKVSHLPSFCKVTFVRATMLQRLNFTTAALLLSGVVVVRWLIGAFYKIYTVRTCYNPSCMLANTSLNLA